MAENKAKAEEYFTDGVYIIMLTDEERRYLALNAMNPEWDSVSRYHSVANVRKSRTVIFFDGDLIVKVIHEEIAMDDDGAVLRKVYSEFDTKLETDGRQKILPLTSRGKPKPVTPANIMSVKPFGCELWIKLENNKSAIYVRNLRNNQKLAIGEAQRIKTILSDADFHAFMQYYISSCPEDYFEHIDELRNMPHQTVSFDAGDIFRCQLNRAHYAYGLILAKISEIEKWAELPKDNLTFRGLAQQPILIRMYDFVTTKKEISIRELSKMAMRPPEICCDNNIIWGTHKIVASKALTPDDIQFPFQLTRLYATGRNDRLYVTDNNPFRKGEPLFLLVEWGFSSVRIPYGDVPDNIRKLLDEGKGNYYRGGVNQSINPAHCGRTLADILKETPGHIVQFDLLLPENRDKFNMVMRFLNLPEDCTVDAFAAKYGGISRQAFIELVKRKKF